MHRPRFFALAAMILIAAASRLIPHPLNFAPITAMALFGGARFSDKRLAFAVPLVAMFMSDLILGLHDTLPFVYGSFALIVCIGFALRKGGRLLPIAGATLASSVLFFVLTNFGVWAVSSYYPKSLEGILTCYIAAVPFFQNTLLGDVLYTAALFGGFALAERRLPILREQEPVWS